MGSVAQWSRPNGTLLGRTWTGLMALNKFNV